MSDIIFRFTWMRVLSVALICFYYYVSLFRKASDVLGVNIEQIASVVLLTFFSFALVYFVLNFRALYLVYKNFRLGILTTLLVVSLFTLLTKQSWLLIPFILFLSFADGNFKLLAKYLFVFSILCFISVVAVGLFLPEVGRDVVDKSYSVASIFGTDANSLGFPNSNHPLLYFTVIAINGAFLFSEKKQRRAYALVMFIIASILFLTTLSVTGYICVSFFLLVYAFATVQLLKIIRIAIPIIAVVAIVATPLIATRFGYENGNSVNEALSRRPYLWNLRVSDGAYLNVVGNADNYQSKDADDTNGLTLDNQYLLLIARYGWLVLLLFFYVYFIGIQRVTNPAVISGLLAMSIYFMFEAIMFILVLCIVPVVMIASKMSGERSYRKVV